MMRFARIAALLAALTLVGVACGGDEPTSVGTTPPTTGTTSPTESPTETGSPTAGAVTLTMTDNVFDPVDVTIASGAELEMVNNGAALHSVTIEGTDFDKDVNAGETETESVDVPAGSYRLICKYHVSIGMEGTITVTG
jgi:plastocyanin